MDDEFYKSIIRLTQAHDHPTFLNHAISDLTEMILRNPKAAIENAACFGYNKAMIILYNTRATYHNIPMDLIIRPEPALLNKIRSYGLVPVIDQVKARLGRFELEIIEEPNGWVVFQVSWPKELPKENKELTKETTKEQAKETTKEQAKENKEQAKENKEQAKETTKEQAKETTKEQAKENKEQDTQ